MQKAASSDSEVSGEMCSGFQTGVSVVLKTDLSNKEL